MTALRSSRYRRARGPGDEARPRWRRRGARAGLAAIVAVLMTAVAAPAALAAPWPCDSAGYVTQWDSVITGGDTLFQRADRQPDGTYDLTTLGTYPVNGEVLNGIGFRVQDGFVYAFNRQTQEMVRIEDDGTGSPTFDELGVPTGLPAGYNTVTGTFLEDGTWFSIGNSTGGQVGVIVDVTTTPTPTVLQTLTLAPDLERGSDIAVSPIDGKIYSSLPAGIYELVISGGTVTNGPRVGDGVAAGAQWFLPDGRLVQYNNGTPGPNGNGLYASDLTTGARVFLGSAPPAGNVDGTSCANGLALTKDASPRSVAAGAELTYTHTITSRALQDGTVDFVDQLPAGMTYAPGGVTVGGPLAGTTVNAYGGTGTLEVSGTISPQTTVTITTRVRVSPDHACGVDVQNQSQSTLSIAGLPPVTIDSDDPTTPENPDDATVVGVTCSADVDVVKTATTSPIVPGEDATFTLVATNHGPSTATNVSVSDQLPEELAFSSASQGCAEAGGTVTCAVGSLAPGASQTFTVTGTVDPSLEECLENTATVSSATPDPVVTNNTSTICTPIEGRSDLSIAKSASRGEVEVGGGQVMYTLVVRNNGPSDDPGVAVRDSLAAGLTLVSAEPSQGSCSTAGNAVDCDLGALRTGGSAQVLVTVDTHATPGCITNTARVQGARQDPDPDDNQGSAQVCVPQPPPGPPPPPVTFDLEVDKRVGAKRPRIGQRVTYRIVVTNNGPDAAPDVNLTDTLSAPVRVVSVRATQGSCTKRIPMRCELGTIAAGDSVTVTIRAKHRELGCRQINAASATGSGTDSDPANNMDTVRVCVRKVALRVTKVATSPTVRAGQTFGYRIRVKNRTRGVARRVRVCDRLPRGIVYVASKPRAKLRKGRHCWTIKRLGPKRAKTFRVRVRALRGASGRKVNRVVARSPDARKKGAQARRMVRVLRGQVAAGGVTG